MPLSERDDRILALTKPKLLKISTDASNIVNRLWEIFLAPHMDKIKSQPVDEEKMVSLIMMYRERANDLEPLKRALQELGYETIVNDLNSVPPSVSGKDGMVKNIKARLQSMCENVRNVWGKLLNRTSLVKCFVEPQIVEWEKTNEEEIDEDGKKRKKETEKVISNYEQLFKTESFGNQIVIEGDPGIGKTTYVNKLALDWTWDEGTAYYSGENSRFLQSMFDVVFLIPLRSLNGGKLTTVAQAANIQLRNCGSWLNEQFERNPVKCLLILDAFDEYDGSCTEINDIIEGTLFPQMKVIITTRPSHVTKLGTKNQWLSITGLITADKRERFLINQGWDELEEREMIIKVLSSFGALWHTPLYLAMLCVLYKAKQHTGFDPMKPDCFYVLVKRFTDYIISRKEKEAIEVTKEERMKLKSYIERYAIEQFSLSYPWISDVLEAPSTDAESEHLSKLAEQLGLITMRMEQSPVTGEDIESISFVHQLFLEYYAAAGFGPIFDTLGDFEKERLVEMSEEMLRLTESPFSYFLAATCKSYKEMLVGGLCGNYTIKGPCLHVHLKKFPWLPATEVDEGILSLVQLDRFKYLWFDCGYRNHSFKSFWDLIYVEQFCFTAKPRNITIIRAVFGHHNQSLDHILSSAKELRLICCSGNVNLATNKPYPNVIKFQYDNCSLQWINKMVLCKGFPNLQELNLGYVKFDDQSITQLFDSLRNLKKLAELLLRGCFRNPQSVIRLAQTIETSLLCERLRKLDLTGNILDTETKSSTDILMKSLSKCVSLKVLYLSGCTTKIECLDILKGMLHNSTHFRKNMKELKIQKLLFVASQTITEEALNKWKKDLRITLPGCKIMV